MWYGNNSTIGSVRRAFNQNIDFQSCWFLESLRHHHQYYYHYYVNKQSSFLMRLFEGHVCIEHGNHLYLNFPHQHIRRIKQWKNFPSVDSFFFFLCHQNPSHPPGYRASKILPGRFNSRDAAAAEAAWVTCSGNFSWQARSTVIVCGSIHMDNGWEISNQQVRNWSRER